jgi:hypothetical protein
MRQVAGCLTLLLLAFGGASARADRNVLAPRGLVASPGLLRLEYLTHRSDSRSSLGWATFGLPIEDLGLEMEFERLDLSRRKRETVSLQYTLTGNAFSDIAPAVSVGVRDSLNRGREGRAFYLSMTKTFGLSLAQDRILRDLKAHAGYGSRRLGGLWIGVQGKFRPGFTVHAEYLARRLNASVSWPVSGPLELRAYSLDGNLFYGASLIFIK